MQRGSVYLLVLMVGMIVTVIGVTGAYLSRIKLRTAEIATNAGDARLLAFTAVEHAVATIESDPLWKSVYVGKDFPLPVNYEDGTFKWRITDNGDGTFKITGTGNKAKATRILSVNYTEGSSVALFEKAAYAAGPILATTSTSYNNGPLASGATVTIGATSTVIGNVESPLFVNLGTHTGNYTLKPPQAMPPSSIFDTYKAMATNIPYSSTSLGVIDSKVISSASNPYGTPNANGIYSIDVPVASPLTFSKLRMVGTMVITLQPGASLTLTAQNVWQTGAGNFPILLVKSVGTGFITLRSTAATLKESAGPFNYNPPGTPYLGVSDNDTLDQYLFEFTGMAHIFGAGSVTTITSNFQISGIFLTEGTLDIGANSGVTLNPSLKTNPPMGYGSSRGFKTWQWEVRP